MLNRYYIQDSEDTEQLCPECAEALEATDNVSKDHVVSVEFGVETCDNCNKWLCVCGVLNIWGQTIALTVGKSKIFNGGVMGTRSNLGLTPTKPISVFEFEIGDVVTYQPYEAALPAIVINVFTKEDREGYGDDIYVLRGEGVFVNTTGLCIKESALFKPASIFERLAGGTSLKALMLAEISDLTESDFSSYQSDLYVLKVPGVRGWLEVNDISYAERWSDVEGQPWHGKWFFDVPFMAQTTETKRLF